MLWILLLFLGFLTSPPSIFNLLLLLLFSYTKHVNTLHFLTEVHKAKCQLYHPSEGNQINKAWKLKTKVTYLHLLWTYRYKTFNTTNNMPLKMLPAPNFIKMRFTNSAIRFKPYMDSIHENWDYSIIPLYLGCLCRII